MAAQTPLLDKIDVKTFPLGANGAINTLWGKRSNWTAKLSCGPPFSKHRVRHGRVAGDRGGEQQQGCCYARGGRHRFARFGLVYLYWGPASGARRTWKGPLGYLASLFLLFMYTD